MRRLDRGWVRLAGLVLAVAVLGWGRASGQDQADRPQVWAVVAGVESYKGAIPRREEVASDSFKLTRWIAEGAGWGKKHVQVLDELGSSKHGDPAGEPKLLKPTGENLRWAVEEWLPNHVKKGDVVILSFAGWGISAGDGETKLLPVDARVDDPKTAWLPDRGIEHLLRDRECLAVLSWIDAPILRPDGRREEGTAADVRMLNRLSRWPGSSVWQSTADRPEPGRGSAFAASLLSALGKAPRSVLDTIKALNDDPGLPGLRFRQQGASPRPQPLPVPHPPAQGPRGRDPRPEGARR